jgi:ion channel
VLTTSSVLIVQFESASPDANITTGGDALWWAFVTITTVGYGDKYPVTLLGRATAVAVMFAGVGIIGALASILASLLVSPAPADGEDAPEPDATAAPAVSPAPAVSAAPAVLAASSNADDLARTRAELAETRLELSQTRAEIAGLREELALGARPGGGAAP